MRYAFGDYTLDPQRRELRCHGQPVKLQPKAFDLLAYLVAHRDHVATKQELLARLWPDQYISDATLSTCIKLVRQAVGDSARARWCIQTLHGRGYRWVADVCEQRDPVADVALPPPLSTWPGPAWSAQDHRGRPVSASQLSPPALPTELRQAVPLALDEERKLVTVLAGALANAPKLAATLESEAWYTLRQQFFACAQQEVQHYEGTIQHFTDDGFLAFFGMPVTHEDHAQRAVLAALSLRARVCQQHVHPGLPQGDELAVCIGVHTGQVVVGRIGDDPRLTALGMGDTTHLVHWLLHLAAPGAILLSEATRQLVHGTIHLEALDPVPGQGAAVPAPAYKVLAVAPQVLPWQRGRVLSPFVGREREMAVLQALLAQVGESRGQVVGIVGEPGMGKSRILYEFRWQVREKQYTYLAGQCVSYGRATPYLPLLDLLRHAWGVTEADGPETLTAKVYGGLQAVGMASDTWAPPLLQLLGVDPGAEEFAALSAQARRAWIFDALVQLSLHTSRQCPLVLEVENLHWIDPTSEEWLMALVERLAGAPILLLTSYRPGYRPLWIDKSYATQLVLPRLTADDSRRVVQAVLDSVSVSEVCVQTMLTKADGNPFFLEELAWTVREHGSPSALMALPDTVHAVVAARLDRLPPEAKRLLQIASVIGKDVSLPLLQAITALPEDALHQTLNHLRAAEFLCDTHLDAAPAYTFKHVLTQEAAYHSLLTSTRQRYHRQIAQLLAERFPATAETQPALLAQHYTAAGLHEAALPYWQRAGEHAVARSAHAEAISHLTRALALLTTLPDTPARAQQELVLQTIMGPVLIATRGYGAPEVEQAYTRARELCQQVGDTPQLFPTLLGLTAFYMVRAEYQTARTFGEQCLSLAQGSHDLARIAEIQPLLGLIVFLLGEFVPALAGLEQGIALYNRQQPRFWIDKGVGSLSAAAWTLWVLGYPDQALRRSLEAIALAQDVAHPFSLGFALFFAAQLHQHRREVQATQARAEAAITLSRAQGFPTWLANGTILQGWALAVQGQGEAGVAQIRQGLAAHRATGEEIERPYFLALLVEVYGALGQAEAGLAVLTEAFELVATTGERWWEAELHRLRGGLLQSTEEAETCFRQALAVARQQQAKSLELRAALSLSRLWQQQGKRHEAYELLAPIYGWFTEGLASADLHEAQTLLTALGG
jgi:class 3 adenylate cyclase/DNA-binding winged helix-turn-helix (wHTH) protein/predicted ATPase